MLTLRGRSRSLRRIHARRPRRRLRLHRPANDRKRHGPNGNHGHTGSGEDQWPRPTLGLARIRDRLRQVGQNLLGRGELLGEGVLRAPELLGEPALLQSLTNSAGRGMCALPTQPDRASRHVDGTNRRVLQAPCEALAGGQPGIGPRIHLHLFRGPDRVRSPACHQRLPNGARFVVNRAWQTGIP
jgi:hypothetical protein